VKRSLKHRLSLAYAVGFFVSLAVCFTSIYNVQRYYLLKAADKKLDYFVSEFHYEHLTADMFTPQHELLGVSHIPAAARASLKRDYPGMKILIAARNPEKRVEVVGAYGGEHLRLVFTDDKTAFDFAAPLPEADRVAHMHFEFNEESHGEGKNRFFFMLFSPSGELLTRSPFSPEYLKKFTEYNNKRVADPRLAAPRPTRHITRGTPGFIRNNNGARMRVVRFELYDGNILLLAANLNDSDRNLNRLLGIFAVSFAAMISISVAIGRIIAGRVGNAINRVTSAAREIGSGDYTKRIPGGAEGLEIDRLVAAFNEMTANTEVLVAELKNISENIAHDLRTPLTRMRGRAELTLINSTGPNAETGADPAGELASIVAEECGDMLEMINTMLEITQTECLFDTAPSTRTDFRQLVSRSLELFSTIAEDRQIALESELPDTPLPFLCNESKIQRMIANLLDNAFKFTPPGGTVSISLAGGRASPQTGITLTVSDTGCGIPPADLPHIFERFYRSGASRTLPGNGLGLSLVRAIVIAHKGEIRCESLPGKGASFVVRFTH